MVASQANGGNATVLVKIRTVPFGLSVQLLPGHAINHVKVTLLPDAGAAPALVSLVTLAASNIIREIASYHCESSQTTSIFVHKLVTMQWITDMPINVEGVAAHAPFLSIAA
jgi:hypothetical protein